MGTVAEGSATAAAGALTEPSSEGADTARCQPFTVAFYVGWMLLFVAWVLLGIPIGPGETLSL
ncbi:AbgT family transporter [Streptomyces sp. DW4-2]|uniref:AbgT family transporter n=1 Tax=Streptomyces spirodelae TaxID=2812904 RepID=A0ABS3WQ40_9ACTN|nr:AbgT family transporter [Streptomyces spirodelae]